MWAVADVFWKMTTTLFSVVWCGIIFDMLGVWAYVQWPFMKQMKYSMAKCFCCREKSCVAGDALLLRCNNISRRCWGSRSPAWWTVTESTAPQTSVSLPLNSFSSSSLLLSQGSVQSILYLYLSSCRLENQWPPSISSTVFHSVSCKLP